MAANYARSSPSVNPGRVRPGTPAGLLRSVVQGIVRLAHPFHQRGLSSDEIQLSRAHRIGELPGHGCCHARESRHKRDEHGVVHRQILTLTAWDGARSWPSTRRGTHPVRRPFSRTRRRPHRRMTLPWRGRRARQQTGPPCQHRERRLSSRPYRPRKSPARARPTRRRRERQAQSFAQMLELIWRGMSFSWRDEALRSGIVAVAGTAAGKIDGHFALCRSEFDRPLPAVGTHARDLADAGRRRRLAGDLPRRRVAGQHEIAVHACWVRPASRRRPRPLLRRADRLGRHRYRRARHRHLRSHLPEVACVLAGEPAQRTERQASGCRRAVPLDQKSGFSAIGMGKLKRCVLFAAQIFS